MTPEETPKERVGRLVGEELARRQTSVAEFARRVGLDYGTVNDFINGKRWPQRATRARIEADLSWPDGRLGELLYVSDSESVSTSGEDAGVLLDLPPDALADLTPLEREEALATAKASLLRAAREIRQRVDRG